MKLLRIVAAMLEDGKRYFSSEQVSHTPSVTSVCVTCDVLAFTCSTVLPGTFVGENFHKFCHLPLSFFSANFCMDIV